MFCSPAIREYHGDRLQGRTRPRTRLGKQGKPIGTHETQPPEASRVRKGLVGNLRTRVRPAWIGACSPQKRTCAVAFADSIDRPLEPALARINLEEDGSVRIA